ncbi:MAG: precorrin-4 C(11)-methyltransferase [Oscillospiraceae bacterium]
MVYFVGAGSGDVELITVKGMKLLEKADIIIYAGSLVNKELLEYARKDCEIFNSAYMTLEQVTDIMISENNKDKLIVRLHTGDPSIYGAIREQIDILDANHIPCQVVPGVSSFLAAAASLKAEYTLPNVSQTVIITRMEGRCPVPEKESIVSLASHKASMAIFLSSSMTKQLAQRLVEGGYSEDTKAAIVYKASWGDEEKYLCTIKTLDETAKKHGITKTALILVGDFLGDEYEKSKLYDKHFTHMFRKGIDE